MADHASMPTSELELLERLIRQHLNARGKKPLSDDEAREANADLTSVQTVLADRKKAKSL